jgi:tripartite-type tricarboxylate transporter receptor subunit TctC
MNLPRRKFLHLAAGAAALPAASRFAWAQSYPTRPVRIIVGFPPGSVSDTTARLLSQWLSERLGQSFVIENRTGAASNLAAETAARAPADGYTEQTENLFAASLHQRNRGFEQAGEDVQSRRGAALQQISPTGRV